MPLDRYSAAKIEVMRNPLRTKKTSTPLKAPAANGACPLWKATTATTAMALRPSSAGIRVMSPP